MWRAADTSSDTGSDTGTDTGTDPSTDPSTDTGTDPSTDPSTDPGSYKEGTFFLSSDTGPYSGIYDARKNVSQQLGE